jgi:L-lactate dehydrogenase (cytochrome)
VASAAAATSSRRSLFGARACLIGRPWLYGLAVGRDVGVSRVLSLLQADIGRTLAQLGAAGVDVLDASWIRSR